MIANCLLKTRAFVMQHPAARDTTPTTSTPTVMLGQRACSTCNGPRNKRLLRDLTSGCRRLCG